MSGIRSLPKLAAMFLTEGHRIPEELLADPALDAPALDAPAADPGHPLDGWECPLDAGQQFGGSTGTGDLRMRPPEY
jgi:hypothetical protein